MRYLVYETTVCSTSASVVLCSAMEHEQEQCTTSISGDISSLSAFAVYKKEQELDEAEEEDKRIQPAGSKVIVQV